MDIPAAPPDTPAPPVSGVRRMSLKRNFSWTLLGNVTYAACQWLMLVVIAKLGTPEMVGRFSLGLTVTAPIIMFSNLNLRSAQATDARHEYRFYDYLGLRLVMTSLAIVVIAAVAFLWKYTGEVTLVILIIGYAKGFESISDAYFGFFQQREQMFRIAKSMMLKGIFSLAALGLLLWATGSILWAVAGLAASWMLILLTYDMRNGRLLLRGLRESGELDDRGDAFRIDWATLWRLAVHSFPLGVVATLLSLNTNIPRIFLERHAGEAGLGVYYAIASLLVAGNTVVSALGQSATPRLSHFHAAGNRQAFYGLLLKMIGIALLIGGTGITIAWVFGKPLLTLFYTPEYAKQSQIFVWLMCAAAVMYLSSFFGYAVTAQRKFGVQAWIHSGNVALIFVLSYLLIPRYGAQGAAWCTCSSAVAIAVAYGIVLISGRGTPGEATHDVEGPAAGLP